MFEIEITKGEIEITKMVITGTDNIKDLTLGVGGCGRKEGL